MVYAYVLILTFLINIPFGYLRGNHKKFSFYWFFFIHLPVPLVILLRHFFEVELTWTFTPFYLASYLTGQIFGKWIFQKRKAIQEIKNYQD